MSDVSGGVHDPEGLDIADDERARDASTARWRAWETGARITNEELLELDCDILVLAARENQVHGDNAARLRCRLVAEGANGPTSLEGDAVLRDRGSRSCRTSSRTPAASPSPTSSGFRTSVASSGGATRSAQACGEAQRRVRSRVEISTSATSRMRTAALVAGIRDVSSALEARGSIRDRRAAHRVRDAMIAEPRSLPGTATTREAGEVLTPARGACRLRRGGRGRAVGVVTRKTLVAKVVARGLDPNWCTWGRSPRSRTTRSTPTRRSTRRSASSRRRTRSGSRSSTTAGSSASSPGRCSSGVSPRTRSLRSPSSTLSDPRNPDDVWATGEHRPPGRMMERRSVASEAAFARRRRSGRYHRLGPVPAPPPTGTRTLPAEVCRRPCQSVPNACRSQHRRLPLSGPAPLSLRGRLRGSSRGGCP